MVEGTSAPERINSRGVGATAYAKWIAACSTLSVASIIGLAWTGLHPDGHPLIFAFSVSWLAATAVAGFTRPTFLRMDPQRFRLARWEHEGRLYRRLGVTRFSRLLTHTPLGWLNPMLRVRAFGRSQIQLLLREMNFAEGAHWIGGLLTLGLVIGYSIAGHQAVALSFAVVLVSAHLYPVMLQRSNRTRILRLCERQDRLNSPSSRPKAACVPRRHA